MQFFLIEDLMNLAEEGNCPIHTVVIAQEAETSGRTSKAIIAEMEAHWETMKAAIQQGVAREEKSVSGLTGGDAKRIFSKRDYAVLGKTAASVAAYAIGVNEVNASMGRIVACPTAGSCGIVPAALFAVQEARGISDLEIVRALFTAAGIGMVVDHNAFIAGAAGGCQAECGTAAMMAAGAVTELLGGSPRAVGNAAALAMKNLLGLACDPVAGLVEVPCVKRNGFAAVHAILAADMSLAGVNSVIPVDEVIDAMKRIGRAMPSILRETAEGGLATSPTGRRLQAQIYPK